MRFSWNDNNIKNKNILNIYKYINNYKPCFHPLSICINEWKKFKTLYQEFQIYSAKYFSINVKSIQCGNKMIDISNILLLTTKIINQLQNITKQNKENTESNDTNTPLPLLEFIVKQNRFDIHNGEEKQEQHSNDSCCGGDGINNKENEFEINDDLYDDINESMIVNITKMLKILNPSIKILIVKHENMNKEINNDNDSEKQISTRKLKQYSRLTHCLSLWSCCFDVLYESIKCIFNNKQISYKLSSKYLMSATKMENKLKSNQFSEAAAELKKCIDDAQIWINKQMR